jgi:hypothetical protein
MNSKRPINLSGLLHQRTIEGERIEHKAVCNLDGEMTQPDKPNSRGQRYRLTPIGR